MDASTPVSWPLQNWKPLFQYHIGISSELCGHNCVKRTRAFFLEEILTRASLTILLLHTLIPSKPDQSPFAESSTASVDSDFQLQTCIGNTSSTPEGTCREQRLCSSIPTNLQWSGSNMPASSAENLLTLGISPSLHILGPSYGCWIKIGCLKTQVYPSNTWCILSLIPNHQNIEAFQPSWQDIPTAAQAGTEYRWWDDDLKALVPPCGSWFSPPYNWFEADRG